MAERVGIVAVAQTKYAAARRDVNQVELANEAVKQVLDETGLKFTEDGTGIDTSVVATDDFWDARTLSDVPYGDILASLLFQDSKKLTQSLEIQGSNPGSSEFRNFHSLIWLILHLQAL